MCRRTYQASGSVPAVGAICNGRCHVLAVIVLLMPVGKSPGLGGPAAVGERGCVKAVGSARDWADGSTHPQSAGEASVLLRGTMAMCGYLPNFKI